MKPWGRFSCGKPVLGIPVNADQYYVMEAVERKGAGKLIRAGKVDEDNIRQAVREILDHPAYSEQARQMQRYIAKLDPVGELEKAIGAVMSAPHPTRSQNRAWKCPAKPLALAMS